MCSEDWRLASQLGSVEHAKNHLELSRYCLDIDCLELSRKAVGRIRHTRGTCRGSAGRATAMGESFHRSRRVCEEGRQTTGKDHKGPRNRDCEANSGVHNGWADR